MLTLIYEHMQPLHSPEALQKKSKEPDVSVRVVIRRYLLLFWVSLAAKDFPERNVEEKLLPTILQVHSTVTVK